jgi:hypothetical protein
VRRGTPTEYLLAALRRLLRFFFSSAQNLSIVQPTAFGASPSLPCAVPPQPRFKLRSRKNKMDLIGSTPCNSLTDDKPRQERSYYIISNLSLLYLSAYDLIKKHEILIFIGVTARG